MAIRSDSANSAPGQRTTDNPKTPLASSGRCRNHFRPSTLRRRLRTLVAASATIVVLSGATGCSLFSNAVREIRKADCLDEFMLAHRNKVFAAKSWYREQHCFKNQPQLSEFKAGYIQGYIDVASGSNGCIPCVAPSQYWGWKYQSPGGQAAINAWFAGYPMGVKAAEQEGVGHWGRAPVMSRAKSTPAETKEPSAPESTLMFAPDGTPITDEYVVPGSTKIIESSEPTSPADLQELLPPAANLNAPKADSVEVEVSNASHAAVFEFPAPQGSAPQGSAPQGIAHASNAAPQSDSLQGGLIQSDQSIAEMSTAPAGPASGARPFAAKQAMTFSLYDDSSGTSPVSHQTVDGIFDSIQLPESDLTAAAGTSAPRAEEPGESASATNANDIPFKFE